MSCGAGCGGGDPDAVLKALASTGAVESACRPYDEGTHHCVSRPAPAVKCVQQCGDGKMPWAQSKRFGLAPYLLDRNETHIRMEIFKYGPLGAQMTVYSDFASYKSGVYISDKKGQSWGHAVKLIGWGVETSANGTQVPYWIAANSWCRMWGEAGFFKILRGVNEVNIECCVGTQLSKLTPTGVSPRRAIV